VTELLKVVGAGIAYTAVVYLFAFVAGAIRVMVVAPRVGTAAAVLLEVPVALGVSWWVSGWVTRLFRVSGDSRVRVGMGIVAFVLLMTIEASVALLVFGVSIEDYLRKFGEAAGLIGLAAQVGFAAVPWMRRGRA
jgi:hypothetical protein